MSAIHAPEVVVETICFKVMDATTGQTLYTALDESHWSKEAKYRDAFDMAIQQFPNRHIVIARVPVSTWHDAA